ncbi:hypothetical protein ACLRGF_03540 [Mycetocola zhadangensis]|uniref:hypothetical protein n=1 Tax=Mycetocola zhadangensis TaxID=1164595 RepID=UPI003A4DB694
MHISRVSPTTTVALAAVCGLLLTVMLVGCGIFPPGRACPAIGYSSTVRITVVGGANADADGGDDADAEAGSDADGADIVEVQLCDDDGVCSITAEELATSAGEDPPLSVVEPGEILEGVQPTADPTADPIADPTTNPSAEPFPSYIARSDGRGAWSVSVINGTPVDVVVTAYRSDGSIAGETTAHLNWKRVGGTEACGGPMEAGPVELILD